MTLIFHRNHHKAIKMYSKHCKFKQANKCFVNNMKVHQTIIHQSINPLQKIRTLLNQPSCIPQRVKLYFQSLNEYFYY